MTNNNNSEPQVDWSIFIISLIIIFLVVIPIWVAPEASERFMNATFNFVTKRLGIVYIISAIASLVFLLWIAFGKWGRTVLGEPGQAPVHSTFSWGAMLFCTGIGASVMYWGGMEWVFYYVAPPFDVAPRSHDAIQWASSYGLFHWGPVGWALYCLPAVAIGCSYHLHKIPALRLSAACSSLLGDRYDHLPGRIIDLLFIVGLIGTAATGIGLATSLVSSAVNQLSGLPEGFGMQLAVISLSTLLIAFSVYRGLDKGIKILSNINAVLALILLLFVLLAGPTTFILEMSVTSLGTVLQNFIKMMTWTDPLETANFVEDWTVFYWAWWIALGPFVGMFVAKISEGRSIRQLILGMLGIGSLGCWIFFLILGNYATFLELNDLYPVVEQVQQEGASAALAGIVGYLPNGAFWLVFLALVGLISTATSYDSASYTLAAGATRYLAEHEHPARWHRVFWAIMIGLLPTSLLYLGGIDVLKTASVVASIPILFVYVLLALSTIKMLKRYHLDS